MKAVKSPLTIALLITLLSSIFYFQNRIAKMKHNQVMFSEFLNEIQAKQVFYSTNFELNLKMTGLQAPDVVFTVSQRESGVLSAMVKNKPLLIYRFSGSNCKSCYSDDLTTLQAEMPEDSPDWVRILSSQLQERELLILKRTHNVTIPIYIIQPKSFNWEVEEMNVPYFFVLHPDMTVSQIFVPDTNYPEVSKQYFESVKRLLTE
jgi:hypothetical protein